MVYDDRMSDYIEVKDRIQAFHNKYPDGSLQSEYEIRTLGDKTWIVVKAYAYRTADDVRPGSGTRGSPTPARRRSPAHPSSWSGRRQHGAEH
jgi:hypothetical protein